MLNFARIIKCQGTNNLFCAKEVNFLILHYYSHFVSAKADELINALFLRVAADALGVRLSHRDIEQTSSVVKANIVQYDDTPNIPENIVRRTKSSFCIIQ